MPRFSRLRYNRNIPSCSCPRGTTSWLRLNDHPSGRHFLQIPGPTSVPDRVLRAIDQPTIDHRGPEFGRLTLEILDRLKQVFQTESPVVIYPASGTGAWEAALVNTLSPGDRVLMFETGHFATLWRKIADRLGLVVDFVPGDWRSGADPAVVEARLGEDKAHAIKAVLVVHNETSTGVTSRIAAIRQAIDRAGHPALFMVDTVSGLGSLDYRHAAWGVDVSVAGSQKGLMLPPGLSFNAVSDKALAASKASRLPQVLLGMGRHHRNEPQGLLSRTRRRPTCCTACTKRRRCCSKKDWTTSSRVTIGMPKRRAARCAPGASRSCAAIPLEYSSVLTAVLMPEGHDADALRREILARYDMSLGMGLGKLAGRVFRIGHLGFFNDLTLCGTLCGVEMGLAVAQVPHRRGGVDAALAYLSGADSATRDAPRER